MSGFADGYRDIPVTESELYLLMELGERKERAYLKDQKSQEIAKKSGWKMEHRELGRMAWAKEEKEETEEKKEDEKNEDA